MTQATKNIWHKYDDLIGKEIIQEKEFEESYKKLISDNTHNLIFVSYELYKKKITLIELKYLETLGINALLFNSTNKYGCSLLNVESDKSSTGIVRLSKHYGRKFSVISEKSDKIDLNVINNSFQNIYLNSQVISLCDLLGNKKWDSPSVYPDGRHVTPPLTTSDQYAQSCFEGMVAMKSKEKKNTFVVLRPYDHANRFKSSCIGVSIPEFDNQDYVESIEKILQSNREVLSQLDSDQKVYIRPFARGLEGGYGVGPANFYLFCIQIFPFGKYVGSKDKMMNICVLENKRRSHEGGLGAVKASSNYAQTITDRILVQSGNLGRKYDDIMYLGLKKISTNNNYESTFIEVLDEDSAGNLFFFKHENNKTNIYTPSLNRGLFLPGFTRDTIIHISKFLGFNVIEKDIPVTEISNFDGAFLTGSAVGVAKIGSITYKNESIEFYKQKQDFELFDLLYDSLYDLRQGVKKFDDTINNFIHEVEIE